MGVNSGGRVGKGDRPGCGDEGGIVAGTGGGTFGILNTGFRVVVELIVRIVSSTPLKFKPSRRFFENFPAKSNTTSDISIFAVFFKLLSMFMISIESPFFIPNFSALD